MQAASIEVESDVERFRSARVVLLAGKTYRSARGFVIV